VGPDYQRPAVETPAAYSEPGPWKPAEPRDALPRDGWWKIFADPELDRLEAKARAASPTLRAALARYDEALAAARAVRGSLAPSVSVNASADRQRYSGNRQSEFPATRFAYTTDSFDLPLDLAYEVDLFGAVRRSVESARSEAEAQGAAYQGVLLELQAGVARSYFQLRSLADQERILGDDVALLRDALGLVRKLRQGGANSDLDVYQAETELATVESTALATSRASAEQRHALAVLCGENPEGFQLGLEPLGPGVPDIPVGLPSQLLERRPDVAQAERSLAAANARIGVAKAAFFPSIGLTAAAGVNSNALGSLLSSTSREWAVSPLVSLPLFNGGTNLANYRGAKAAYDEALADYREQVLVAFRDVEDALSDLRTLGAQTEALARAEDSSAKASQLSVIRYRAGLVSYIEVIDAQRTHLENQTSLAQARADRLSAAVLLIQALGGGW
jgi:multidrug efflux system outer membrane protein